MSFGVKSPGELALCQKLLDTGHLNVPERRALPDGRARFSVLVAAAEAILHADGWLPRPETRSLDFMGVRLEARGEQICLHEQYEVGVARFGPVHTRVMPSLTEAVRAYVEVLGPHHIDGVPIDYTS
ncbi:MAG: hypothetical protein AAF809_12765 [Bacteroidota bacterium]